MGGARFAGGAGGGGFDGADFSDIFGSMFGGGAGGNGSHIRFSTNGGASNLNDIFSMFGGGAGGGEGFGRGYGYDDYGEGAYQGYRPTPVPEDGGDLNSKITLTFRQFRQAVKGATVSLKANGKKFKTRIPAGVKDGQKIRLAGKGKPGKHGGKTGDMYLQVTVTEDPKFTMDGVDLVMDLPITVGEAVDGAKVTAKDMDGEQVTFKVHAGRRSTARRSPRKTWTANRSRSRCMPAPRAATRCASRARACRRRARRAKTGDLVGRVQIRVPKKPSMHEKHAAKEFDKMCGDFAADIANEREA